MNGYEPFELGGVWSWYDAAHIPLFGAAIPSPVFRRLLGGSDVRWRCDYGERSAALADLAQAIKDADGNFVGGAA